MKDFKEIAVKTLSLSELMVGREQIKTDDLIGKTATITAFDFATITDANGDQKTFPVLLFKEYPDKYYNGGALLMKLCMAWMADYEDVEAASADLEKSGGVKIKFRATRTKGGNNLTSVDVV